MNLHPRKRSRLVRVAVLLLLGAMVNVAVAWGCALWRGTGSVQCSMTERVSDDMREWVIHATGFDVSNNGAAAWIGRGNGWDWMFAQRAESDDWLFQQNQQSIDYNPDARLLVTHVNAVRCGFPSRSVEGRRVDVAMAQQKLIPRIRTTNDSFITPAFSNVLSVNSHTFPGQHDFRLLPFVPIWPGFAINTLFYAAILWVLFFAPFTIRRWRRMRRGQCPACAYPVGSSDVCTECGKPV